MQTIVMKAGLFPETTFVRTDFAIDTGQLTPKQISINASKPLTGNHSITSAKFVLRDFTFTLMVLQGSSKVSEVSVRELI